VGRRSLGGAVITSLEVGKAEDQIAAEGTAIKLIRLRFATTDLRLGTPISLRVISLEIADRLRGCLGPHRVLIGPAPLQVIGLVSDRSRLAKRSLLVPLTVP